MHNTKSTISRIALSAVIMLGVTSIAFAAPKTRHDKQISYDDAWAICKKFVDDARISWDQSGQRYTRGAACMLKYGYKI